MSEEEQQAIEYLKKFIKWETFGERSLKNDVKTVLNYINKLQKENLEQKKQLESRYYHTINARELEKEINNSWEEKLKTKIKELEKIYNNTDTLEIDKRLMINAEINVLKELLNKE